MLYRILRFSLLLASIFVVHQTCISETLTNISWLNSSKPVMKDKFSIAMIETAKIDTLNKDGAWCWFNDPRAIYYKGMKEQTYFSWVNSLGDIYIASYNHVTGAYIEKLIYPRLQADDHDNPAIFFRKDGRIVLFFSQHSTSPVHRVISTNPEDITSWGSDYQFGSNVTYPSPFQVGDSIYVFYRGINWHPTLAISSDNGETFGTPVQLIVNGGARPYTRYCQDKTGAVHIASTTGHPRNELANEIYYVCFKNGKFYKADGTFIKDFKWGTNPIDINTNDAETVYDASNGKGWIWDITVDEFNKPVMVFAVFPKDTDHRYRYARWTGTNWFQRELTNAGKWFVQTPAGTTEPEPNYSGGVSLDHDNPSIVHLSKPVNGVFEIFKFTTTDEGVTWDSVAVTSNTPPDLVNVRPIVPLHHKPGYFDAIWMRGKYVYYLGNYHTSLVFCRNSSIPYYDFTLSASSLNLGKGITTTVTPSFFPAFSSSDKTITWTSSDTKVATVNAGEIKGIASGTAVITATAANGKTATVNVTVEDVVYLNNAFFDFGTTTSPVSSGAIQVAESTTFVQPYGWISGTLFSRDRTAEVDDELRDFLLSSTPATFEVLCANGTYHIVIKQGDKTFAHDNMVIAVNGQTKASAVSTAGGAYTTTEFDVTVTNNKMDFTFSDGGGKDVNWVLNSLRISSLTTIFEPQNGIDEVFYSNAMMSVFDLSGREIFSEKLYGKNYRDVFSSNVKINGVYIVSFQSSSAKKTIRMIR